MLQVMFVEPPLEERAGVVARRGVALEINQIAGLSLVASAEEMVEPDFVQGGARRVRGDMPAKARMFPIGVYHHRHRIPADQALDTAFEFAISRVCRLVFGRDRVD